MFLSLLTTTVLGFGASTRAASLRLRQASDTLEWQACPEAPAPWECALLEVPLDYANPSVGTTQIAVIRYPATQTPRKGYMFMNPGGPGASGLSYISSSGEDFQSRFGADWDVLSYDPRGVGLSGPRLVQFEDEAEEDAFWSPVMQPGTFEGRGNLTLQKDVDFFMSQASFMDERLEAFNNLFIQRNGENLKYLGSTAVVRDLVSLVDAIEGPDADINFAGYSYGTLLAMQLTQMFPDRVGKVIIDAVVDPVDWYSHPPHLGYDLDIADADATWKGFTEACAAAGPGGCSLSSSVADTPKVIKENAEYIFNAVHDTWSSIDNYSHNEILGIVHSRMYWPSTWEDLSTMLSRLASRVPPSRKSGPRRPLGGIRSIGKVLPTKDTPFSRRNMASMNDYAIVAITCSDTMDNDQGITTEDVFEEMVRVSQTVSPMFGSQWSPRFFCHRWTSKAVERYTGPWNVKPKNVVMVVGNEADPITPFRSAKLIASEDFLGSSARLIQQWDFGHTSSAETSNCTRTALREYANGAVLPDGGNDDPDLVCQTNFSILGTDETIHWDPITSENGDSLTSDSNDPGIPNIGAGSGHGFEGPSISSSAAAILDHRGSYLVALASVALAGLL